MPTTTELINTLTRWYDWISSCAGKPISAPECGPIWTMIVILCAAFGLWVLAWFIWQQISYHLKYKAAIRAQIERDRVADPETMQRHKYKEAGDIADITDPELSKRIRAELDRQKLESLNPPKQ